MKRVAIYFFFDKDGIVDDYNIVMLDDIKKSVDNLLVVVNGKLNEEGKEKFSKVSDEIFIRENKGFDVWAYKEGIEHLDWKKINEFDELILFNFTNFGPIYSFKEMFDEMDSKELDFWGITEHYGHDFDPYSKCKYGYIPRHIQSSFIAVRKNMFQCRQFHDYWEKMPMVNDYADAICLHEAIFTEDFTRAGFKSEVYVKTEDLKEFSNYPLMLYPTELIKNRKCPIFKRKTFFNLYEEFLDISCGQTGIELYEYLRANTDYDLNLVWDNLLRTANMYDIKNRMQLNYILPDKFVKPHNKTDKKVALFMHIYSEDLINYCCDYAVSMPEYADILITTDKADKKTKIEEAFKEFKNTVKVFVIENRGRDVSSLLVGLKQYVNDYDYICFAHDKKSYYDKPYMIGQSFSYHCFENVLASKEYVENVITTFDENPRLGLLVPPTPYHGPYYSIVGLEWQNDYLSVKEYAKKWGINVDINDSKPPIAPLGTMFWFRKCALDKLYEQNFDYKDFPEEPCREQDGNIMHAIERMYAFATQAAGYYCAWGISEKYSKLEITNLYKMLRDVNQTMFWNFGVDNRHMLLNSISVTKQKADKVGKEIPAQAQIPLAKRIVRKLVGDKIYVALHNMKTKN